MISVLMDLIDRDMDDMARQLADLLEEQRQYAREMQYWTDHLNAKTSEFGLAQSDHIAAWLQYGERAERELEILEEKDFLVGGRISNCRDLLLNLNRRKNALQEVLFRRQQVVEQLADRRQTREMSQRSAARRMLQEGEEPWG